MTALLSEEPHETTDAVLFVAAGFEERSVAYLKDCANRGKRYLRVVIVDYLPHDGNNRLQEALNLATIVGSGVSQAKFDRFHPFESTALTADALVASYGQQPIVLDVSGMSKFLALVLVTRLMRVRKPPVIAYTEPSVYHPTKAEWLADSNSRKGQETGQVFLTTGLFGITTVPDLTLAAMGGEPVILVASPNFEPRFIRALINELTPSKLVLLEGRPPGNENSWRHQAVRETNAFAFDTADQVITVSTASVEESRNALEEVFSKYKYSHRMIVVPAASKLSAVGFAVAIATIVECEVIYPTPVGFRDPYTSGTGPTHFVRTSSPLRRH